MKTLAIHLRLETASHRRRMMGIFRRIGATEKCDIRIVSREDTLCNLLAMANPSERPDGIISGIPYSDCAKNAIVASGLPFVGIGMSENDMPIPTENSGFALNDNEGIGRAAAEYFLRLGGFRSFAYVPDVLSRSWSKLRGDAFVATLHEAGRDCETFRGDSGSTTALSRFLSGLSRPAAVLAAWDGRAADVIHAAHLARLDIPGAIAILGVDDDDFICEHTFPPLSSVKTDAEGMGEAAAQIMLDMLGKRRKHGPKCVRCHVLGITERHTTRPPAPASVMIDRALAFIKAEATNGIRPSDVAKFLKVSRRLLDLRFRQFESKSVAKTITQEKLAAAMRLLAETVFPVKSIFRQSGFGNISHATRFFKRATGVSPEAWRTLHSRSSNGKPVMVKLHAPQFEQLSHISQSDETDLSRLAKQLSPSAAMDSVSLRDSIRCGTTSIFVLRRRSHIIASVTAIHYATPTGIHCRIEDVVVDERMRGNGFGRKIMQNTLDTLRAMNVRHIELTSRPSRIAARSLYRSFGFTPRKTNVLELHLKR